MPILDIVETPFPAIVQQCANCGSVASIPKTTLVLGHAEGELASDPNVIVLPPCACGAVETLNQTFDVIPEELAHHRKKVNALAVHLKAIGQIHPSLADVVKADKRTPKQLGALLGPVPVISGMPELPVGTKLRPVAPDAPPVDPAQASFSRVISGLRRPSPDAQPGRRAHARRAPEVATAPAPQPIQFRRGRR